MAKYKLILDKNTCVDCSSCVPEAWDSVNDISYFVELEEKGIHLTKVSPRTEGTEEIVLELNDTQVQSIKSAMDVCPVACIRLEELS